MVTESFQTSPSPEKVATVLATNAIEIPRATGTSIVTRLSARLDHAAENRGAAEKKTTGTVSIHSAQRNSCS